MTDRKTIVDAGTRLVDLTVGDLVSLIRQETSRQIDTKYAGADMRRFVVGVRNIAKWLGVHPDTASFKLHNGCLDYCTKQVAGKWYLDTSKFIG